MRGRCLVLLVWCGVLVACAPLGVRAQEVVVGSKQFTESVILGELVSGVIEQAGVRSTHRRELGGTRVLFRALLEGEIDVYPEYTGTISEEILGRGGMSMREMRRLLEERGVRMSDSLGFENSYAIGMLEATAERLSIERISDLARHPELSLGFTNEFMDRPDGWPGLRRAYVLPHRDVRGLDHDLAYRGLASGSIAVTDLYSTDADIAYYGLRVLEDDRDHFPEYRAVLLHRADLEERAPAAMRALAALVGAVSESQMIRMNADVKLRGLSESHVAASFANEVLGMDISARGADPLRDPLGPLLSHLALVGISLGLATALAVPLGILSFRYATLGKAVLTTTAIIQTIPSLALLVFMIPLLGIGAAPAIAALFLYSLLPIVRNTHAGLAGISDALRESAEALGLSAFERLQLIELPLASRSILAGIKTSAVINIGTATLGALIGAGGLGQPILTGIRLDDLGLILQGAIPAALLALLAEGGFHIAERYVVPKGLRLQRDDG